MTQFSQEVFRELNDNLLAANAVDEPITVTFRGRPAGRILGLDPPTCDWFGLLRNRGPRLSGRYLLASLIDLGDIDAVMPFGALLVRDTLYAAPIGLTAINHLTERLGMDDINWVLHGQQDPDTEIDLTPDSEPRGRVIRMQDFRPKPTS